MRKTLWIIFILLSSYAHADAWDNLTKEQAENTVQFLKENPYIFDYCDCCNQGGLVRLIKVDDLEIVPCDWDSEYFSVKYSGELIGLFPSNKDGIDINSKEKDSIEEDNNPNGVITMNYTWVYNADNANCSPLFSVVSYDVYGTENKPCLNNFSLPNPKVVKNKAYKKWYKSI